MIQFASVLLRDGDGLVDDVQLWNRNKSTFPQITAFHRLPFYINHTLLPPYMVSQAPCYVYSATGATADYFKHNLVLLALLSNAALCFVHDNTYLIFYYDGSDIRLIVLDFTVVDELALQIESDTLPDITAFLDNSQPPHRQDNTLVFDKVLERKKSRSLPFVSTSTSTLASTAFTKSLSLVLTSQDQINQAINKIILSGLRIRGLSTNLNNSVNDKLSIKEIYHMTYKSTLFSLRKFNYSFGSKRKEQKPLRLADLQETVERLLEIYVDVDDTN